MHNTIPETASKTVSFVIPFHNEEENLKNMLLSLDKIEYSGKKEVILINDNSTDKSIEIIKNSINECNTLSIKVLDNDFSDKTKLTSKQQAIETGVKAASGELLFFTDADTEFSKNILKIMCNNIDKYDLIFGKSAIVCKNKSLFCFYQAKLLDFLFLTAFAFAKIKINTSAMGNNILIKKESYLKSGGQKAIGYSITEDRDLIRLFRNKGFKVAPSSPFVPTVFTKPAANIKDFFNQQLRWIKGGIKKADNIFFSAIIFGIFNITPAIILIFRNLHLLYVYIFNLFLFFILLNINKPKTGLIKFIFFYLSIIAESVILLLSLPFVKPNWHGKKV